VAKPTEAAAEKPEPPATDAKPSPDVELLNTVREILRRELAEARTEEEVAALLAVTKPQARAWLSRLVEETVLEKLTKPKPVRYRTTKKVERLL
jgi:Fic family protein